MERIRNSNPNLPPYEQMSVAEIIEDVNITSFFTGKTVEAIFKERSEWHSRVLRHMTNVRLMAEDNLPNY